MDTDYVEALYQQLLDAGLQFQALGASKQLRQRLYLVSEQVIAIKLVKNATDDLIKTEIDKNKRQFSQLCLEVPHYTELGVSGLPRNPYANIVVVQMAGRSSAIKPLNRKLMPLRKKLIKAQDRLNGVLQEAQKKPSLRDDLNWQRKRTLLSNEFKLAQSEEQTIEQKILAIRFFGEDIVTLQLELKIYDKPPSF